jgi:hypothetical protein
MDRLLTNREICKACPANAMLTTEHTQLRCSIKPCIVQPDFKGIAKAQDTKTATKLIAEIENHRCEDCTMQNDIDGCTFADLSCGWWQQLKEANNGQ